MIRNPIISVVMPVYNCARYVSEAIESILNQTYKDFEFIIINDGSTDETPEILDEYAKKDSRIRIINQPNNGIVGALNRGLFEAKYEWIFRMDGDDISLPHRFAVQIKEIKRNPSLVLLGGWCQRINSEGIFFKVHKYPTNHQALVSNLENFRKFFPHPTVCFRRDIVLKIGGYRERFQHAEDYDLWLRLSIYGRIGCVNQVILQLRKHKSSVSENYLYLQQLKAFTALICHFRRKSGFSDPSQIDENMWQYFLKWLEKKMDGEGYFQQMQGWQALRHIWYSNLAANKIKRSTLLMRELLKNSSARKAFWRRLYSKNLIPKLVEESKELLNH